MQKLWQKEYQFDKLIEDFETKGDLVLDQKLVQADVLCSMAHAMGLQKIGILTPDESQQLKKGLQEIYALNNRGAFVLQPGDEDIHTKIEQYLTDAYGAVGKKIHTGRSRNDQVLVATRLYTKEQLQVIWEVGLVFVQALLAFATEHENALLAGYTHMQRAMPSSVGMWAASYAEGILDSLRLLCFSYQLNDQSPLGSGAGYGVPLPLEREYVADLLGFERVQINAVYCQNSRGKIESAVVASLIALQQDINKFATDVMLFTTAEFGFFTIRKEYCSGSSIMPQKRNVDVAELLRSKLHVVLGNYTQMVSMSANLMSGYNRDLQDSKKPFFESLELTADSLRIAAVLLSGVTVNHDKLQQSLSSDIFATHYALDLVKGGMPFRDAYKQTSAQISSIHYDVTKAQSSSSHVGGIGNLGIALLKKRYREQKKELTSKKKQFVSLSTKLLS